MSGETKLRRLLPSEVAAQIRAKILDGSLAPGDRLPPERELAAQLQVNRSSVREALKKLEELRLVDIQQGSGTRVRSADEASFELVFTLVVPAGRQNAPWIGELLELREMLLPGMLRLSLERATDEELEKAVAEIRRIADPALPAEEFLGGIREMQRVFAKLTHNRVLLLLANSMVRFLEQPALVHGLAQSVEDRKPLTPLLQRFAIAVAARDEETSLRAAREIFRRVTRLVVVALAGDNGQAVAADRNS